MFWQVGNQLITTDLCLQLKGGTLCPQSKRKKVKMQYLILLPIKEKQANQPQTLILAPCTCHPNTRFLLSLLTKTIEQPTPSTPVLQTLPTEMLLSLSPFWCILESFPFPLKSKTNRSFCPGISVNCYRDNTGFHLFVRNIWSTFSVTYF